MTRTFYQVWRFNPLKDEWFYYPHIPNGNNPDAVKEIFLAHKQGKFKGNQFKSWMTDMEFKIVKVEQTIADWETL
jgi:hypothetical protein